MYAETISTENSIYISVNESLSFISDSLSTKILNWQKIMQNIYKKYSNYHYRNN